MDAIPLFLNDASYPSGSDDRIIEGEVLDLLRTLRGVKALNRPFIIGAAVPLSDVSLSSAYSTLASYAAVDREWWRFIKGLDQRSPFHLVPQSIPPNPITHVAKEGSPCVASLWAIKNDAFMISLPTTPDLREHVVVVEVCDCLDELHVALNFECRNLSVPAHVDAWRNELLDFNYIEAASSTIYENEAYRLKMYLHDHEPPHVHVYLNGDFRTCVGRVRFDHVEVMEDNGFSGSVKKGVLTLLEDKQQDLLRAWARCRAGNLPNRIDLI